MSAPAGSRRCSSSSQVRTSSSALLRASIHGRLVRVHAMPDVLMYARHLPVARAAPRGAARRPGPVPLRRAGRACATSSIGSMEMPRLEAARAVRAPPERGVRARRPDRAGPLVRRGRARDRRSAPCEALGVTKAIVPETFPLWLADELRDRGVELTRRRGRRSTTAAVSRTAAQLAGIRRAQRAAEAGWTRPRDLLRRAERNGDGADARRRAADRRARQARDDADVRRARLHRRRLHRRARRRRARSGTTWAPARSRPSVPIVIDIWPRDNETFCFCDMTRTFVVGEVPDEVREWHRLCKEALDAAISEIKAGVDGRKVFDGTCEIFEARGRADPAHEDAGRAAPERLLPRARPRRRPRGARGAGHGARVEGRARRRRRRHGRARLLPPGLRRRAPRGPRARHRGGRREPDAATPTTSSRDPEPGHRHALPRGAALPPVTRVRCAGERTARDLRRGVRRVLGARGPRARRLVRAVHDALRVGAAVREVVPRRQAQRRLELSRQARRGGARRRGRLPLGRASRTATAAT